MLSRASNPEALGFLSGEVSLASKPEELLIAIAHRCRKLIIISLTKGKARREGKCEGMKTSGDEDRR
jgi:hypothetical protein